MLSASDYMKQTNKDDLIKQSFNDPVLHQCVCMYKANLCTWEEAMEKAAFLLSKQKDLYVREILSLMQKSGDIKTITETLQSLNRDTE